MLALVATALCLSGCAWRSGTPAPEQSCRPGLVVEDTTYRQVEDQTSTLEPGAPVDANLLGCDDGAGLRGGGPIDAWRAEGKGDGYVVTLTECARRAGTEAAADCDPTASRYTLWKAELR